LDTPTKDYTSFLQNLASDKSASPVFNKLEQEGTKTPLFIQTLRLLFPNIALDAEYQPSEPLSSNDRDANPISSFLFPYEMYDVISTFMLGIGMLNRKARIPTICTYVLGRFLSKRIRQEQAQKTLSAWDLNSSELQISEE